MKRYIAFLLIIIFQSISVFAQKCYINFYPIEKVTEEYISGLDLTIMYNDTLKIPYKVIMDNADVGVAVETDYKKGRYKIFVEKDGYKNGILSYEVTNKRNSYYNLGKLALDKQRTKNLGEVVVRSTHIKMVHRNDTIVYDASAFELAEGSMLDALVSQLPGAELKDGQIKVNGKLIDNLIINGEDFFNGNPKVALKNLPAYTVKNIKVYDKASDDAYLRAKDAKGKTMGGNEQYVMDVVLKKAYSNGWLGNFEGGYGLPSDKYLGKSFVLGYNDKVRVSAFANLNNIMDTQVYLPLGEQINKEQNEGRLDVKMGGLGYFYKQEKHKLQGNIILSHEETNLENKNSGVSFFETGDIYSRAYSHLTENKTHLLSNHKYQYSGNRAFVEINPSIDYLKNNNNCVYQSAQFITNPIEQYRMQSIDSLFAYNGLKSFFVKEMLNKIENDRKGRSDCLVADLNMQASISMSKTGDMVGLSLKTNYRNDNVKSLSSYNKIYGAASTLINTGVNNLQSCDNGSKNYGLQFHANYSFIINPYQRDKLQYAVITPSIDYSIQHYDYKNNWLKLQEILTEDNIQNSIIPPSAIDENKLLVDLNNTSHSHLNRSNYYPGMEFQYTYSPSVNSGKRVNVILSFVDNIQYERLNYNRYQLDTLIVRTCNSIAPKFKIEYYNNTPKHSTKFDFSYYYSQNISGIYNKVRTINDSDPTNIYINNTNLKNVANHRINSNFNFTNNKNHRSITLNTNYGYTKNAEAQAHIYDRNTGVNTWLPMNINGNWYSYASVQYTMPFGKKEAFQLDMTTSSNNVHSADYATDTNELERSVVNTHTLRENISLKYNVAKCTFGIRGDVSWIKSHSKRASFEDISAFDIIGSANALINLPHDWQIGTDISLYCRRGYSDNTLNMSNWVWNASLAKSILKGNLTFKLNAVDMLAQISNVQHTINAQGRTETWVNSQPRYVMLHVIYRFNVKPKKKAA